MGREGSDESEQLLNKYLMFSQVIYHINSKNIDYFEVKKTWNWIKSIFKAFVHYLKRNTFAFILVVDPSMSPSSSSTIFLFFFVFCLFLFLIGILLFSKVCWLNFFKVKVSLFFCLFHRLRAGKLFDTLIKHLHQLHLLAYWLVFVHEKYWNRFDEILRSQVK